MSTCLSFTLPDTYIKRVYIYMMSCNCHLHSVLNVILQVSSTCLHGTLAFTWCKGREGRAV
jgi:hypothetical protein